MDGSNLAKDAGAKAAGQALIRDKAFVAGQWVSESERIEVDDPAEGDVRLDGTPRGRDETRTAEIRALCGF